MSQESARYRVRSEDHSIPGTTDELVIPVDDFGLAVRLAARLSGPMQYGWVDDLTGERLYAAGPTKLSA